MARGDDLAVAAVPVDTEALLAAPPPPKLDEAPQSMPKTIGAIAFMTVLALVAGGLYGIQVVSTVKNAIETKAKADEPVSASRYVGDTNLKDLPPIITNLAEPRDTWIRLEVSLVCDTKAAPIPDVLTGEITGDILAFLRTLTLAQIEGAAGLRQLREDLNERVAIRTEGRVRELIIQTLVVQ
ncbi:MAG: flagellar basal body-associated FliL family protein [Hyphomicrobiales bacterium]